MTKLIALILCCLLSLAYSSEVYASEETAVLAGGCFWCLEHDLEKLPGVVEAKSGYTGGVLKKPTYFNHNGHQEAVEVHFNTEEIDYESLLRAYWRNIDPLDGNGQFCDRGDAYRPVIFPSTKEQEVHAIHSIEDAAQEIGTPQQNIKVEVKSFLKFWLAEDYHQNYAQRNKLKYNFYRSRCGRDNRLNQVWGKEVNKLDVWKK
tara:strand:- start:10056 stop:10667 length:612 start_codon:yes stop_codon:yes gene_type:complete